MFTGDTIAAISSAAGPAARMIVRASGPGSHDLARLLSGLTDLAAGSAGSARVRIGGMSVPSTMYVFAAPHSYTGEDMVEFHIPGNPLLARLLIDELLAAGARQAEAGEFTARAYFNGRLNLTEAEGVAATIAAHSAEELRAARQLLGGELSRRLRPLLDQLAQTLALVEVGIDFSEEDVTFLDAAQVAERVDDVDASLADLVEHSARMERLSHEPTFVLAGRPNAGKSTLLNALAGHERAIASPLPGTTRDVLSAEVALPRGMVRLIDAAGLDAPTFSSSCLPPFLPSLESSMRYRAIAAIEQSDFVLLIHDCTDERPPLLLPRKPDLIVVTKIDLCNTVAAGAGEVAVSAATGENLDLLKRRLEELAFSSSGAWQLALTSRHREAIAEARAALGRAKDAAPAGSEVVAMELREALDALGRILGQVSPDDLLGRIFSAFCIGK